MENGTHEKNNFWRPLKARVCAIGITLLSSFLLCFVPDRPFGLATNSPADQLNEKTAEKIHETFRLYGVIKSNAPHCDDHGAWELASLVRTESQRNALDPMLVLAVIKTESSFEDKAISVNGARGLMQILPFVGEAVAQKQGVKRWNGEKSLDDPKLNVKLGISYLKSLKQKFSDLSLTLAAYRWGPVEIANRINSQIPIPLEYSQKVLDHYRIFRRNKPAIPKVIPG